MAESRKSAQACIFCGRSDRKNTREHIISEWIAKEIHADRPDSFRYEVLRRWEGNRIHPEESLYRLKTIDIKTKGVCDLCNNGWMSQLETTVQSVLTPLIQGSPQRIDRNRQSDLASWACLKMMVLDHSVSPSKRPYGEFFSSEERKQFHEDTNHKPPRSVLLVAAHYQGGNEAWLGVSDFRWDHSSGNKIRVTTMILSTGKVAFIMLGLRIPAELVGKAVGIDKSHLRLTSFPLYPIPSEFDWPPPESLSEEALQKALHHWRVTPLENKWSGEAVVPIVAEKKQSNSGITNQ